MITKAKLEVYALYNGDVDAWSRGATKAQRVIIDNSDWSIISSLLQDIELSEKQLLSKELLNKLEQQLKEQVQHEAIALIKRLASTIKQ